MADDAAEEAYAAAVEEIARVKAAGENQIFFNGERFRALHRIPPEITSIGRLDYISFSGTHIDDITTLTQYELSPRLYLGHSYAGKGTPRFALKHLRVLELKDTFVSDISLIGKFPNLEVLDLSGTPVENFSSLADLKNLVSLIVKDTKFNNLQILKNLKKLSVLILSRTSIYDISPILYIDNIQAFIIESTNIKDLSPVKNLKDPQLFDFNHTQLIDLRPIVCMKKVIEGKLVGVNFKNTPATARDGRLAELAEIENDEERARETLAYLRSLPPWPEPYTPAYTPDGSPPQPIGEPPEAPDADAQPRLLLTNDDRIDIAPILPGEAELDDPIRRRLYERLPRAVDDLLKAVNRYPEIDRPVRSLKQLSEAVFKDADFLMIHLDINALTDLRQSQSNRPDDEKLDPDCLAALDAVLHIGPGITMGHPDIEALEARGREYERSRVGEGVAEHERKIASALGDSALATERTQQFARVTAASGSRGRVADTRHGFVKNTVLVMALIAGKSIDAAAGNILGGATVAAAEFLIVQSEAILATAPTWGQSALVWAEYVLIRARQIIDEARQGD